MGAFRASEGLGGHRGALGRALAGPWGTLERANQKAIPLPFAFGSSLESLGKFVVSLGICFEGPEGVQGAPWGVL